MKHGARGGREEKQWSELAATRSEKAREGKQQRQQRGGLERSKAGGIYIFLGMNHKKLYSKGYLERWASHLSKQTCTTSFLALFLAPICCNGERLPKHI